MYNRQKLLKDNRLIVTIKGNELLILPYGVEGEHYKIKNSYQFASAYLKGKQVCIVNDGVIVCTLVEKNGNVVRLYLDKQYKRKCNGGNENE